MSIETLDINGFTANQGWSKSKFMPPCIFYVYTDSDQPASSAETQVTCWVDIIFRSETICRQFLLRVLHNVLNIMQKSSAQKKFALIFVCVPVSPGKSRLIWCFPRNFGVWIDKIVPRWIFHVGQNRILDSDLYLLHVEVFPISYHL